MNLIRWNPRSNLTQTVDEIERFVDGVFGVGAGLMRSESWSPDLDIYEDKDNVYVEAELPGLKKDDIKVSVEDDVLTIRGEKKKESRVEGNNFYRVERHFGTFQRAQYLPSAVKGDKINATYRDGVLAITLPKADEAKKKEIEVKIE